MTNEEKEAVDILKGWLDYNKRNKNKLLKADELIKVQETVLNLMQTQQEEIIKLQAKVDRLKVARDNWKKTFYQAEEEIEKYKYLYQKALDNTIKADRDNLKKDKIIDLTIAFISTRYKEDEDINNFAKEVMERGEWTNLNKILKEYFINKVEKENKDE